ncbi:PEP-CTERM sorting domain-containing protein [Thiohalorhabdus methylotrophus]|uniref:PEP-CTERM sorting domain-containing protein n=1 Tax=Thiohalorhabdus methylotrophus TaxID=3242694 RepID=A0ABV4TU77_9GAMM
MESGNRFGGLALVLSALLLAPATASAISVSLGTGNQGIDDFSYSQSDHTIMIQESWGSAETGTLAFDKLEAGENYTVYKEITNNSGSDWNLFANELLDPADGSFDAGDQAEEDFVPAGYSHSNETDGLSFAQGSGIPRTSDAFANVTADEIGTRDFLDYGDGILASGETATVQFGLRDNNAPANEPFLIAQRPNMESMAIPGPATAALFGLGLVGLAGFRRRDAA